MKFKPGTAAVAGAASGAAVGYATERMGVGNSACGLGVLFGGYVAWKGMQTKSAGLAFVGASSVAISLMAAIKAMTDYTPNQLTFPEYPSGPVIGGYTGHDLPSHLQSVTPGPPMGDIG